MKRVEGVWAELSANQNQEVELSEAKKVELSSAKELNKLYKQIDRKIDGVKGSSQLAANANRDLRQAMQTGRGIVRDFRSSVTDVEADVQRLESAMNQFEQALKELGVSPKDSPDWNGANAMMQQANDVVRKYEQQVKELVKNFSL